MKAARIVIAIAFSALSSGLSAQTDKCAEAFKAFESVVATHEYNEALLQYNGLAERCPKVDEKLYLYGERVFNYQIEASQNKGERQKLIDGLFALYNAYDKNYPSNTNGNAMRRALLSKTYELASPAEQYTMFEAAFTKSRTSFTDYNAIEALFLLSLQQAEMDKLTQSQFIERYGALAAQVNFAKNKLADRKAEIEKKAETKPVTDEERTFLAEYDATADSLDAVRENMEVLANKKINCGDLDTYYSGKYEASAKDVAWLESVVTVMSSAKCFNAPTLEKSARALYEARPDAMSAYMLGNALLRRGKGKEAVTYFDKAATLEKNNVKKADLFYTMASIYRNIDKKQAKQYVLRSAELNPKSGKPYLFLAEMYSSVTKECELGDFERKALFWLAADAAQKATLTDARYKATAASLIEGYKKRQPTKADAKAAGKKKGDQVTFGCWINESVTVPNL